MTMFTYYILLVVTIFFVFLSQTFSQTGVKDSKGTDFWLTFLPNYHSPTNTPSDSLYLFIASEFPTTGTITFKNINGNQQQVPFQITNVSAIHQFAVHYSNYELKGFNQGQNRFSTNNQVEKAAPQTFHIVSNDEVTVYGLNQAVTTSDAFLVLPTDALGREYFVLSYPSDGKSGIFNILDESQSTPSEFAIVATEDNTTVQITLSTTRSYATNGNVINATLQQGEAFLVQAYIASNRLNDDLTGTNVVADKPIALFAGHQRATVPFRGIGNSRDHICEQIPPYDTWGNNAYVVPFVKGTGETNDGEDRFVILSGSNNNVIYRNNIPAFTLNTGQSEEFDLKNSEAIRGTFPILVATYKKQTGSGVGDPLMMLIPPAEQFLNSYKWINAQVADVFEEQYTTVVVPNATIPSILIDNQIVTAKFTPIPTTDYSYVSLKMTDGVHTIKADRRIGIYVYGYGRTDSYGYTGGMQLLNQFKPVVSIFPERIEAETGDTVSIGIIVDSLDIFSPTFLQANISKVRILATVNATIATPSNPSDRGEIRYGKHYFDIEVPISMDIQKKSVIKILSLIIGLGDAEQTEVVIDSVIWLTIDNETVWSETKTNNGLIVVADIWKDEYGTRLVNPQELKIGLKLGGTLVTNNLNFEYKSVNTSLPTKLEIISIQGSILSDESMLITAVNGNGTVNISDLPNGSYYIRLSNGSSFIVREFKKLQ